MDSKFTKGEVVKLKSGSPKMTVKFYDEIRGVVCQWFDAEGKLHEDYFSEEGLVKFKPSKRRIAIF